MWCWKGEEGEKKKLNERFLIKSAACGMRREATSSAPTRYDVFVVESVPFVWAAVSCARQLSAGGPESCPAEAASNWSNMQRGTSD